MSVVAYLVRHSEVEHHRADVGLTPRGRALAQAAGTALYDRLADGDLVYVQHAPVTRVQETADLLYSAMASALRMAGRESRIHLYPPQPDPGLRNVRFIVEPGQEPQEPTLAFARINSPGYLESLLPARATFFRGFWASPDRLGFWLTHDSAGAAETTDEVWARLRNWLQSKFADHAGAGSSSSGAGCVHWIGVTHSGGMRVVLRRALGFDPGEPDDCEAIIVEPSGETDRLVIAYRGQGARLALYTGRTPNSGVEASAQCH